MTDFAALLQPDRGQSATLLHRVDDTGLEAWLAGQPPRVRAAIHAQRFTAKAETIAILPGEAPDAWSAAYAPGDEAPWALASAAARLPEGAYRLAEGVRRARRRSAGCSPSIASIATGRSRPCTRARACCSPANRRRSMRRWRWPRRWRWCAISSTRRPAISVPRNSPTRLRRSARSAGARVEVTAGEALAEGYPMVHAVGRAATRARAPRLIELHWGDPAHPRLAIVGKGVCFDSGGLDIKNAGGMLLMKKDMGGAAHALALARLVMGARLPVSLHLLIPAVENAIAGDAFRPGDILRSRQGLHVEIGNTDAEGRLILADALTRACAGDDGRTPDLILDFATLTGAGAGRARPRAARALRQ